MADGFIYFAHRPTRAGETIFKVGFSTQPYARIKALSCSDFPVTLIGFIPGKLEEELVLHALLDHYRINGEWYRAGRKLHRIMTYCLKNGAVPSEVTTAGEAWLTARLAKRAMLATRRSAGAVFSDDKIVGITRDADPFFGNKIPANDDLSWVLATTQIYDRCRKRMAKEP